MMELCARHYVHVLRASVENALRISMSQPEQMEQTPNHSIQFIVLLCLQLFY